MRQTTELPQSSESLLKEARAREEDDPAFARQCAADVLSRPSLSPAQHLEALLIRAKSAVRTGDFAEAASFVQTALSLAHDENNVEAEAEALYLRGRLGHLQGDNPASVSDHARALALRRDTDNIKGITESLSGLGSAYLEGGDWIKAEPYLIEALRTARAGGFRFLEAGVLNNLAVMKDGAGNREEALPLFLESVALYREFNDATRIVQSLANIAATYSDLEQFDQAEQFCDEALRVALTANDRTMEPWLRVAQSGLYRKKGRYDDAWQAVEQGLEAAQVTNLPRYMPLLLGEKGLICSEQNRFADARQFLESALASLHDSERQTMAVILYGHLAEVAEQQKDFAAALGYEREQHRLERETSFEAAERHLQASLARMQLEKAELSAQAAEHEAELLRQHQLELTRANNELLQANSDKQVVLERLQAQTKLLEELSIRDSLTGLYNRRYLDVFLEQELLRVQQNHSTLSVALFDLDNFKYLNDRFSHQVGDYALKEVARIMQEVARPTDVAVRYGGEELVLVMPDTPLAEAEDISETIREAVAAFAWTKYRPHLTVTTSIGISDTVDATHPGQLLAAADIFLYRAKTLGKNRICSRQTEQESSF